MLQRMLGSQHLKKERKPYHLIVRTFFIIYICVNFLDSSSNQITQTSIPLKSSLKSPSPVTPLHVDITAYHHPQFLLGNDDTGGKDEEKESSSTSIQRDSTSTLSGDKDRGIFL